MGFPKTQISSSPENDEQMEPLDLRVNRNCGYKSPFFRKRRHLFDQYSRPLDLRVKHGNTDFSYSSAVSEIKCTTSNETKSRIYGASISKVDNIQPFHKKTNLCSNLATRPTIFFETDGSMNSDITDLIAKNNPIIFCEKSTENNHSMSITTSIAPCHVVEKSPVLHKVLHTMESITIKRCHKSCNETQAKFVMESETVKDAPLINESNLAEKSSVSINYLTNNKEINGSDTSFVQNTDKKHNLKRLSESGDENSSKNSSTEANRVSVGREYMDFCKKRNLPENNIMEKIQEIKNKLETEPYNEEDLSPKKMKLKIHAPTQTKPSVEDLKKSGESFVQDGKCFEVAPKLPRCRECSTALQELSGKTLLESENILCRFYAFRKLRYSSKGFLATGGFLDPHTDITPADLELWQPTELNPPPDLNFEMAKFMLNYVGDQFCALCKQEEEAIAIHMSEDKTVAWKRPVPGCREMCDVCNTTLFNFHWTCRTCGFAVCIDCYKARKGCDPSGVAVERPWLICVNKRAHDQEKLMLTQIVAGEALQQLGRRAHEVRASLGLPLRCCAPPTTETPAAPQIVVGEALQQLGRRVHEVRALLGLPLRCCAPPTTDTPATPHSVDSNQFPSKKANLIGKALSKQPAEKKYENSMENTSDVGVAPDHLPPFVNNETLLYEDYPGDEKKWKPRFFNNLRKKLTQSSVNHCNSNEQFLERDASMKTYEDMLEDKMLYVVGQLDSGGGRREGATRIMTCSKSRRLYHDCPHSWLCEGRLLRLSNPSHAGNYKLFQDQWKRGQPVLVSGVLKSMDESLWQPDTFIKDFGNTKNDLVNCMTGRVIPGQYMRKFWEGFQNVSQMLKDEKGKPMLLKLKDWPPGEDFAELMPSRFEDLMRAVPMGEYTKRTGQLNLTSRLPSCFARPDLGPKMYIAYGSAIHPTKGTTNLHLDISDAVNVMVYVGIPKDIDRDEYIKEAYRAVDEACFEPVTRRRVREATEVPGALWHIYSARDTGKIRHLLARVARERRIKYGPHQDPIHDQSWYLDAELQRRLWQQYGVRGYAIVQCLGDAVFIPAGAPHQVLCSPTRLLSINSSLIMASLSFNCSVGA